MLCYVNSYIYRTAVFGQINQFRSYGPMLTNFVSLLSLQKVIHLFIFNFFGVCVIMIFFPFALEEDDR